MMHADQLERFRRMSPRERTRLMLELMDLGWDIRRRQGPDAVPCAVEATARIHRASTRALLAGLEQGGGTRRPTAVG
jgi:hypothetical protein